MGDPGETGLLKRFGVGDPGETGLLKLSLSFDSCWEYSDFIFQNTPVPLTEKTSIVRYIVLGLCKASCFYTCLNQADDDGVDDEPLALLILIYPL